jgi:hypothetical protein
MPVWALGNTPFQREAAYTAMSEPPLTRTNHFNGKAC